MRRNAASSRDASFHRPAGHVLGLIREPRRGLVVLGGERPRSIGEHLHQQLALPRARGGVEFGHDIVGQMHGRRVSAPAVPASAWSARWRGVLGTGALRHAR